MVIDVFVVKLSINEKNSLHDLDNVPPPKDASNMFFETGSKIL